MKNQDNPRQTGPTEESLRYQFKQMTHEAPSTSPQRISSARILGKSIVATWKIWRNIGLFILVLFLILIASSVGYILIERWQIRSQRNAMVDNIIETYVGNYQMDEWSIMGEPSQFPKEKAVILKWFSDALVELNRRRGTSISAQSSLLEKAEAAEEIVGRNLKLTDGADWDNGENTRFSRSGEVIKRGGGDETDLALMKVTFLRIMGVPDENAYVVLYIDSTEADARGVAVVKLPDGKEMYLDKTKSTRAPGGKAYRELVEFGVRHSIKKREN